MRDVQQRLEKLQTDAEECRLIARLSTNPAKRQAFDELANNYEIMARALKELIAAGNIPGDLGL